MKTIKAVALPDGSTNANPIGISFGALVLEDLRNQEDGLLAQGFWALFVHRFGNWRMGIGSKVIRAPFSLAYKLLFKMVEVFCGIKLSYNVPVGRNVCIEHFGGMIIGARSIGNNVTIRQNTTIGIASKSDRNAKPIIHDNVDIGCGVVILGDIQIGRNSVIGANSVVVRDIPENSLAVGSPAKVIRKLKSENVNDELRRAS